MRNAYNGKQCQPLWHNGLHHRSLMRRFRFGFTVGIPFENEFSHRDVLSSDPRVNSVILVFIVLENYSK